MGNEISGKADILRFLPNDTDCVLPSISISLRQDSPLLKATHPMMHAQALLSATQHQHRHNTQTLLHHETMPQCPGFS